MKKELYSSEELQKIDFQELPGSTHDDGGYYTWWVFYKGDSELHITYEYNHDGVFESGYIEFNGEQLKGREITKRDVEFLIELM